MGIFKGNWTKDIASKIGKSAKVIGNNIGKIAIKILIGAVAILILYIIVIIAMSASYSDLLRDTCIEADEFGGKNNVIRAKPTDNSQYTMKGNYKHNTFTQKINQTDLGLSLNGEPITINITGKWMPWFGDLSESELRKYNTNENFICAIEKYKINDIGGQKLTFSNNDEENEFWYIKNYYSEIKTPTKDTKNNKIIIEGVEEPPERQKECWIVGGVGLYLGSFGINGRTEPSAYHHLKASKLICNKGHWFNGEAGKNGANINMNYVITTYGNEANQKSYKMSDFIKNYFSVSYYSDPEGYLQNYNVTKNWESSEAPYDDGIFEETDNQIIYHIDVHEKNLESRLKNNRDSDSSKFNEFNKNISYGYIVANSISKFMQACYQISKDIGGDTSRVYMSYFQYGPKKLYKNIENVQDIPYEYGEKIKMLIVDKFYENNQGFYQIEIISGIQFDDSDSIEKKIREVEFYLLGTPGEKNRRSGGIIERIFNNLLSETFKNFAKAILVLYVIYYGFRVIFGFKKDRNDRSVVNNKDLMITLFKFIIITIFLTSDNVYLFFSETILSFVVDGIIGIIDLIAGIFSNSFITNDNISSLTGGLKYANEIKSLARNFSIVDEILNFFTEKVIIAKVMAFAFNFTQTFGSGLIISIGILMVLILYIFKLVQSIVPFIFVLVQLAIVLPLAPLFILFSLFKETSYIFQNWLKFILSKCLELIGFFTAFYFCTSFINNFIKQLLNYRVCFIGLGDKLFPEVDNEIGVDSVSDFFEGNWAKEILKKIFNRFLAISIEGLPDNYFIWYVANILITALLVIMFDTLIKEVMNIINNILTIDGAMVASGGRSAMNDAASGTFSFSKQFSNFNKTMGGVTLQNESDALRTTKGIFDLQKGIARNSFNFVKGVHSLGKSAGLAITGNTEKAKEVLAKGGGLELIKPFTEAAGVLNNKVNRKINEVEAYKQKVNKYSLMKDNLRDIWKGDKKVRAEVEEMIKNINNKEDLKNHIKNMDDRIRKKIFGDKDGKHKGIFEHIDINNMNEIDTKNYRKIKRYLKAYADNKYKKKGIILDHSVVYDDKEKAKADALIKAVKNNAKKEALEILKNMNKDMLEVFFGNQNAETLSNIDYEKDLDDHVLKNIVKHLESTNYGDNDLADNIVSNIMLKEYGKDKDIVDINNNLIKTLSIKDKIKRKAELEKILKNIFNLKDEKDEEKIKKRSNDLIKIFGKKNYETIKNRFDKEGVEFLTNKETDNLYKLISKNIRNDYEELDHNKLILDIKSNDFGKKKDFVYLKKLFSDRSDRDEFEENLKKFTNENRYLAKEIFGDDITDKLEKGNKLSDDEFVKAEKSIDKKEIELIDFEITKPDPNSNEILVKDDEGEAYKIRLKEDSDGNKKVDTSAIFDQDGTKIFEVKDTNCILKVDNVEYIITSTEDNETIVSIAKEDGTTKELTKEEKNAALQAKIEKKLEKFNKMMKEAEEFEKNNHSEKYLKMSNYGSEKIYYNIVSGLSFEKKDSSSNEILVKDDEGEEYKIKLEENSDGNKKVDTSAIFDQDGTKIFEVKDANCILKVDNVEYIITSTEDNGTIVSIAKEDGTTKKMTKEEKNAALQAKIEKKLEKFNKMMKEAEEFEKNNHSEK